jgi:hypothetical protein
MDVDRYRWSDSDFVTFYFGEFGIASHRKIALVFDVIHT